MFSCRSKPTQSIFEFVLIFDISDSSKGPTLVYFYPETSASKVLAHRLIEFVLPCDHKPSLSEEYTFIFTDVNGDFEYMPCLLLPLCGYVICIRSFHPYFELFHWLLSHISQYQLYLSGSWPLLSKYLSDLTKENSPANNNTMLILSSLMEVRPLASKLPSTQPTYLPIPNKSFHPHYYRHILEYFNAMSISNWVVIMESLLLERSIVFHSNRFQRVTSCIFACLSLLYPLTWMHSIYPLLPAVCIEYIGCPTPFVAGIHSCMLKTAKSLLTPGARLVDLDSDTVYTTDEPEVSLPHELRDWLVRRCNLSHSYILRHSRSDLDTNITAAAYLVEPFLELLTILLGGYRDSMHYVSPIPSASSTKCSIGKSTDGMSSQMRKSEWVFDRQTFIQSRGDEFEPYLRELLQSQMVVEFLDSRLDLLNSDMGMIPPDDFEDCINRVAIPLRSNLMDWIRRGRSRFGRLVKKLEKLKKPSANINLRIFKQANPNLVLSPRENSAQDASSSRSSSDTEQQLDRTNDNTSHGPPVKPSSIDSTHLHTIPSSDGRWRTFVPTGNEAELRTEWSNRTLVSAILEDIPDLPATWVRDIKTIYNITPLAPPPTAGVSRRRNRPTLVSVAEKRKQSSKNEPSSLAVSNQSTDPFDVLSSFDPYSPVSSTVKSTPQSTTTPKDDLSDFLRQLDPLNQCGDTGTNLLE